MVEFVPTQVSLLDSMGSDKSVVDAARVSFAKFGALGFGKGDVTMSDESLINYLASGMRSATRNMLLHRIMACGDSDLITADEIVEEIRRTAEHWTPFGHCMATFHVRAPIFVHRQITRSGVGLVINEESRRYVDDEPEFYKPKSWRGRATDKKQGSTGPMPQHQQEKLNDLLWNNTAECNLRYTEALFHGAAPEQARMFLPLNTHTQWVWTGSLYAWARVCKLRIAKDAQEETREVAEQIVDWLDKLFPFSSRALVPPSWRR